MIHNPLLLLFTFFVATSVIVIGAGIVIFLVLDSDDFETGVCRAPDGTVREVTISDDFARSFDRIWDELKIQAIAGAANYQITLTESEVSSRVDEFLSDDVPLKDVTVCFHDGYAEAWALGEVPTLHEVPLVGGVFDAGARGRGSLDFSGDVTRFTFSELDVENVPGFVEDELQEEAEREVNEQLAAYPLDYTYSITFTEGVAIVSVTP